ncbi:hypothetical protein DNTS_030165 [Danionella cerebrum]|uniref:Uncharacterized protein n=1 Tax=Danionella cerebrum TaxID=2873325 RepID=A0A553Q829_9TELE|nr:hypothetical protein DNTS_030165 [Danionella translucida]
MFLHFHRSMFHFSLSLSFSEYENVLKKFVHGLSDSVKVFSSQGNREAAKDALGRLKMVENEVCACVCRL